MNIAELSEKTGQPARNIRYLIAEGIVPGPEGTTKSASYGEAHLRALGLYSDLKRQGFHLRQIKERVAADLGGDGILVVEPREGLRLEVSTALLGRIGPAAVADALRTALEERMRIGEENGHEG